MKFLLILLYKLYPAFVSVLCPDFSIDFFGKWFIIAELDGV